MISTLPWNTPRSKLLFDDFDTIVREFLQFRCTGNTTWQLKIFSCEMAIFDLRFEEINSKTIQPAHHRPTPKSIHTDALIQKRADAIFRKIYSARRSSPNLPNYCLDVTLWFNWIRKKRKIETCRQTYIRPGRTPTDEAWIECAKKGEQITLQLSPWIRNATQHSRISEIRRHRVRIYYVRQF